MAASSSKPSLVRTLRGAIAPGRYADIADLIAVESDPIDDIRVLENIALVMKGGEVVADTIAAGR